MLVRYGTRWSWLLDDFGKYELGFSLSIAVVSGDDIYGGDLFPIEILRSRAPVLALL